MLIKFSELLSLAGSLKITEIGEENGQIIWLVETPTDVYQGTGEIFGDEYLIATHNYPAKWKEYHEGITVIPKSGNLEKTMVAHLYRTTGIRRNGMTVVDLSIDNETVRVVMEGYSSARQI
jgi:hypothetical protein